MRRKNPRVHTDSVLYLRSFLNAHAAASRLGSDEPINRFSEHHTFKSPYSTNRSLRRYPRTRATSLSS